MSAAEPLPLPLYGLRVVLAPTLRRGIVYRVPGVLVVGTLPPTEVEQIVMDGVKAAHPWLRDPLRADPLAMLRGLAGMSDPAGTQSP